VPKRIRRRRDADPRQGLKKYGKATFADPVNNKYPINTPGRIKAAWAYIHQPSNAEKFVSSVTPEPTDFLAGQGIPLDLVRAAQRPVLEAHNRQETPLFARSIERHALKRREAVSARG
jgi:hypothetical protein